MKDPFEAFGALARSSASVTLKAGRRNMQADAEQLVPDDIAQKLMLAQDQSLFEIGCGPGTLLKALAPRVSHAVGMDHKDMITVAREQCRGIGITFIEGAFPDTEVSETFDRILMYSVLQYQADMTGVFRFVDAALALLNPGGRLLIGDIPNTDMTRRFRASDEGKVFEVEWAKKKAHELATYGDPLALFANAVTLTFNDERVQSVVSHYQAQGYTVSILPQSPELPQGHTRHDILIEKS